MASHRQDGKLRKEIVGCIQNKPMIEGRRDEPVTITEVWDLTAATAQDSCSFAASAWGEDVQKSRRHTSSARERRRTGIAEARGTGPAPEALPTPGFLCSRALPCSLVAHHAANDHRCSRLPRNTAKAVRNTRTPSISSSPNSVHNTPPTTRKPAGCVCFLVAVLREVDRAIVQYAGCQQHQQHQPGVTADHETPTSNRSAVRSCAGSFCGSRSSGSRWVNPPRTPCGRDRLPRNDTKDV